MPVRLLRDDACQQACHSKRSVSLLDFCHDQACDAVLPKIQEWCVAGRSTLGLHLLKRQNSKRRLRTLSIG
eukprot:2521351-Amphidinium_carterae.1